MLEIVFFLAQGIPEITGLIALIFAIARVSIPWKEVILLGAIFAVVSYLMQTHFPYFGMHTVLILFLIILYVARRGQVSIVKSFMAGVLAATTVALLELLVTNTVYIIFDLKSTDLLVDRILWSILGMPQAMMLILIAIIVSRLLKPQKGIDL